MRARVEAAGRRFARLVTGAVVARPWLWRLFRTAIRRQFGSLASSWEGRLGPEALVPLEAALDRLAAPPRKALDLGTGTGKAARVVATRFADAEVVGVDLAPEMVEEARRVLPAELRGRVSFAVADGAELPFADGEFDLVVLQNAIPFFDELARVTAPAGTVVFAFSHGPETPIWVPPATLRAQLAAVGLAEAEELSAGPGTALVARRRSPG
ncbi:MAG TPA: class I SAM-dependent methyltransferase [Gaiellaceae bacterium]|nr:class I SAM-dependent methyltransferase [Gaiellaceae bacterium]